MKHEINRIYDKITPPMSSEEVTARVLERAAKTGRKRSFRPMAAAAAVAVTFCAATVAAGAANDWDYLGFFKNIFGEKAQTMSENIISNAEILENTFEDVSFEVAAAAADPTTLMIFVDSYYTGEERRFNYSLDCENPDSEFNKSGYGYSVYYERISECYIRTALYMSGNFGNETYRLTISSGSEKCVISFTSDYSAQTVSHIVNAEVNMSMGTSWWIEKAEISALSVHFMGVKGPHNPTIIGIDMEKVFVLTSDGEKHALKMMSIDDMCVNKDVCLYFKEPLDPEDVIAIDFGTDVLELK